MSTASPTDPAAPAGPGRPAGPRTARPPSRAVLALAWLLATVLAATVAWWAVAAVGGDRGAEGTGLVTQAQLEQQLADQAAAAPGDGADGGAAASPDPTASSSPGATASPAPTPTPTPAPDTVPVPPVPTDVARTWDVTGGQVGAVCSGATIGLVYATPADGWSVEVEHAGPAELEVRFTRAGERSRVRAECVAGTPEITRSGDDGGGRDDGSSGDDD